MYMYLKVNNDQSMASEDKIIEELRSKYIHVTSKILPNLAREKNWVIRQDHCFQRVILDNIFGDIWYKYLDKDGEKPAYQQLDHDELEEALELANKMQRNGSESVDVLNSKSLHFRDKSD